MLLLVIAAGALILWQFRPVTGQSNLLSLDTWHNRRHFQSRSLTLVQDYPFIGSGLDSFKMLYSTYVMLIHVGFISDSHNLFLSVAIDQGLPALLSLIAMWILFAVIAWRMMVPPRVYVKNVDPNPSLLGVAALSLIVVLVHGMVESALYGQGVVLLFFPLAYAVRAHGKPSRTNMRLGTSVLLLCLCMPLGLMLLMPRTTLSMAYSNLGSVHQSQTELSVYAWPEWVVQDEVRNSVDLDQAIAEFEQALTWNPRNATANRRLAMIELSQGRYKDALRHLELAHSIEPDNLTTRQLLGEALIVNGRVREGLAQWDGLSNEQMQLHLRAFWYEYIGDVERAAWIRKAAELP
jgi:tetratricopeptide (TPR) repeat protein